MEINLKDYIYKEIEGCKSVMEKMLNNPNLLKSVESASQACIASLNNGNKILLAGNGGSAADAQHIAGELVSRFKFDRPGLPAIALTTDTSILTAIGNDYGYENLFFKAGSSSWKSGRYINLLFNVWKITKHNICHRES